MGIYRRSHPVCWQNHSGVFAQILRQKLCRMCNALNIFHRSTLPKYALTINRYSQGETLANNKKPKNVIWAWTAPSGKKHSVITLSRSADDIFFATKHKISLVIGALFPFERNGSQSGALWGSYRWLFFFFFWVLEGESEFSTSTAEFCKERAHLQLLGWSPAVGDTGKKGNVGAMQKHRLPLLPLIVNKVAEQR